LPPARYKEKAVASVSTHDLPTGYGFLASEQIRVRAAVGQLDRPVEEEERRVAEERDRLFTMMRAEGLALPGTTDEYPSWRLPLADAAGTEVSLEAFLAAHGTARIATLLQTTLHPE
ncbi:MAG TPA: hypothetical protein VE547_06735, partial [Mycobacteriales bacterium]|nr:hypothetical protein [Mycobacteriales bacterium]